MPKIYFVIDKIPEELKNLLNRTDSLCAIDESLFSQHPQLWGTQEWSWIIQTFLHVRQKGLDVALVEQPVPNAICVAHWITSKDRIWAPDSFVVGIRSDTSPMRMKEVEIVQSPAILEKKNAYFICLWPQSDLKPRDVARKNTVETLSYFGGPGGLSPAFKSDQFKAAIADLGVTLNLNFGTNTWGDYRQTDLVLAVRNHHHPWLVHTKPASKLINTWQAGCVALLGAEPAYQKVGTSGQDYFEIETPEAALAVIKHLKADPALYQRVRQAGEAKYQHYSFEALTQQWVELLTGPITDAFRDWQNAKAYQKSLRHPRRYWQSARQWLDHKVFYIPVRSQEFIQHIKEKQS